MLHKPVLLDEVASSLFVKDGDIVVDCTFGCGGHSSVFLQALKTNGMVLGIDRDPNILEMAKKTFHNDIVSHKLIIFNETFLSLKKILSEINVYGKVSVILADLGISSVQIDSPERGFSFSHDGPLDMRMNNKNIQGYTAADIVNSRSEIELATIFKDYGEETKAKYYASKIVEHRKLKRIETTKELADLIVSSSQKERKYFKKHPATKIFQALRIEVNQEIKELEALLPNAFGALRKGGRLGVISFHSLEDRCVKKTFLEWETPSGRMDIPKKMPIPEEQIERLFPASGKIIKPFPMKPKSKEIEQNIRSRSARLRVIERIV